MPKTIKKQTKKIEITDAQFKKWFCSLSLKEVIDLNEHYSIKNLDLKGQLKLPKNTAKYNDWLEYFKKSTPNIIRHLSKSGQYFLTNEAFAALSRWMDILKNPGRIESIYNNTKIADEHKKKAESIVKLSEKGDTIGVLKALQRNLLYELQSGTGARDTDSITKQILNLEEKISEFEKKHKPKTNTKLAELMGDVKLTHNSPKRTKGKGTRNTSYKSKLQSKPLTIEDIEAM